MSGLTDQLPIAATLLDDIEASPTPYHAVERAILLLEAAGFESVDYGDKFPAEPGRYFVTVGGALVAWVQNDTSALDVGRPSFTIVGTHTDSPNLRVRTKPDVTSAGWAQLGVETYGGLLLNSWLDRDLGLAGRVRALVDGEVVEVLVRDDQPILRIPQLAIHLDRDIRDKGLKLNPQTQMTPLWATAEATPTANTEATPTANTEATPTANTEATPTGFVEYLGALAGVIPESILSWDMMAFDTQPPAIVGRNADMIASARIDNLFSTFCAVRALINTVDVQQAPEFNAHGFGAGTPVLAMYDHEEVGSESATGASGAFLGAILERISAAQGNDRETYLQTLANSFVVSADGAHATHPNYVDKHDPNHHVALNAGVVVKRNANQRYASDARSEAHFRSVCVKADIPVQTYIHRNDLPCGSTIGPVTSAELAIPTVDIGAPQLAMHSIREMAGVKDADYLYRCLAAMWLAT